jgi:hypothetical protein
MSTVEERARERITITSSAQPVVVGADVSWPGVWAGFLVATAVLVILSALGIAIGMSVANLDPSTARDLRTWGVGSGLWGICSALIALFVGGMTSTRTGLTRRPLAVVEGTLVWMLSLAALFFFGVIAGAGTAVPAAAVAVSRADPGLAGALQSANVDQLLARLNDPTTADRLASATGLPRDRVLAGIADARQRVEANRTDPARAAVEARTALDTIANVPPSGATAPPSGEAAIAGWVGFVALIVTLAVTIAGAAAGVRSLPLPR